MIFLRISLPLIAIVDIILTIKDSKYRKELSEEYTKNSDNVKNSKSYSTTTKVFGILFMIVDIIFVLFMILSIITVALMIVNMRVVSHYDVADSLDFFTNTTFYIVKSGILSGVLITAVDAYLLKDIITMRKVIKEIKKVNQK